MSALYPSAAAPASARRAPRRAAQPGQLRDRLARLVREGARELLQPDRRAGGRAQPGDAGGSAGSLQPLGRSPRLPHLAEPEVPGGSLQRVEEPAALRQLTRYVHLRFLLGEPVVLGAGAERVEERRLASELRPHPGNEERR